MAGIKLNSIKFKPKKLGPSLLIQLYRGMLKPRMIEEKMLSLLRQGKVSKWFSGIGQEAISVGVCMALNEEELMFTLHRNLGVFTTRKVPLKRLFSQWQGKMGGFTKGRDRSFHFGAPEFGIIGMISHLGPQLSLADGVGLAYQFRKEPKVTCAFTGDGGTSQGEFHEALNVASVWKLPVIFIVENNGYGLSTPVSEQFACKQIADKGIGYGLQTYTIDGNNILKVYRTIRKISKSIRKNPHPVLVECMTFRMRGHEEASGTKYVPQTLLDAWAQRDPLIQYEKWLLREGYLDKQEITKFRQQIKLEIDSALEEVSAEAQVSSFPSNEETDVFKPYDPLPVLPSDSNSTMRFVDAIKDGLDQALQTHPELILMGQDIAEYGGMFKITEGFLAKYGPERIKNTPLCESAILGMSLGLSICGIQSMVEMQFSDFVTCGFNQIINNLAKVHYRWQANADVVIRMPCGAGTGAGPFHSQTNEAWFFHTPGLKIVYPSSPYDAKGLLLSAFEDPNPVLYFEHKALYRKIKGQVPEGYYNLPIGKGKIIQEGSDITVITYGAGVHWIMESQSNTHISIEIIDLRSLAPLDWELIIQSVQKTHRVLILHEDNMTGGIGAEIAAYLSQYCFRDLDAPIFRTAGLDTPVPFALPLEENYLANSRLEKDLELLMKY